MLLLVALAGGGLTPIQTAANSRLSLRVGNRPVIPTLFSVTVALLLATAVTTVLRGHPVS